MRRTSRNGRILTAVVALTAGLLAGTGPALAAPAPKVTLAAETYTWKNARRHGQGACLRAAYTAGRGKARVRPLRACGTPAG